MNLDLDPKKMAGPSGHKKTQIRPQKKAKHEPQVLSKSSHKSVSHAKPSKSLVKAPPPLVPAKGKGKARESTLVPSKAKGKEKDTAGNTVQDDPLPSSFKVISGTYEKLLYGLEGTVTVENSGYKFALKPVFIFPAHISCIKVVAASPNGGKWLATGSADEIVKVWDLRRRKEIGGLMHHEGLSHPQLP